MKIKLRLNKKTEEKIKKELLQKDIEITESASLILTEEDYHDGKIACKLKDEIVYVDMKEISYIESVGKDVYVNTVDKQYKVSMRIYQKDNEQKFAASTIGDFYKCILYIGNLNQDTDFKIIMGIMDESARKKYNEAEEKAMNKSSSELPNQEDYVNSKSEVFIKIDKNNLEE